MNKVRMKRDGFVKTRFFNYGIMRIETPSLPLEGRVGVEWPNLVKQKYSSTFMNNVLLDILNFKVNLSPFFLFRPL